MSAWPSWADYVSTWKSRTRRILPSRPTTTQGLWRAASSPVCEAAQGTSVLISCFDRATCRQVRDAGRPRGGVAARPKARWRTTSRSRATRGFNALNPHFSMLTPDSQFAPQRAGSLAQCVDRERSARDLTAMGNAGVASVITDEPALWPSNSSPDKPRFVVRKRTTRDRPRL